MESVRKPTKEIVDLLNEYQPSMIGCYPTAMELLAAEQEKGNLHIHPAIIMTGGEKLNDDVREYLSNVFDCYVQTNYSCTEGGTIACECTEKHFHMMLRIAASHAVNSALPQRNCPELPNA